LCSAPNTLSQLAWLPSKLLNSVLKQLSFTIRQIGKATDGMDLSWQYVSGCKFVGVSAIGT
jgi:hypothetical protein